MTWIETTRGMKGEAYLELCVPLNAIWIVSEATVVRSNAGLGVAHIPRFGPQYSEEGGGVHGSGADLMTELFLLISWSR